MSYTFIDDLPGVSMPLSSPQGLYAKGGKRLADITVVLLISPIALLIIMAVWVLTRIQGGSGFYCQPRVGRFGRTFRCWKIRTMGDDAESKLSDLIAKNPDIEREWSMTQKLLHDPRITSLGRILRATSIDELPQLWNVLIGDMSLFGPRPFMPAQKGLYDENQQSAAYYRLRPGISGLWQVSSRSKGAFTARVDFDEKYARNISLSGDLSLAFRTIVVVLRVTGK
ncbi:MAG: sugar transferase [Paracoccaceae bacterium]